MFFNFVFVKGTCIFSPSFFENIDQLEEGCLRLHVRTGDILVMPANYLHFVLTTGDAIAMGTNFLALGHLPMIKDSIILEHSKSANDKFPDLPEMFVLMMYKLIDKLSPRLYRGLVSLYNTVRLLYSEKEVRKVKIQFQN